MTPDAAISAAGLRVAPGATPEHPACSKLLLGRWVDLLSNIQRDFVCPARHFRTGKGHIQPQPCSLAQASELLSRTRSVRESRFRPADPSQAHAPEIDDRRDPEGSDETRQETRWLDVGHFTSDPCKLLAGGDL